jgi:hemerythrin-like domain-containing protein
MQPQGLLMSEHRLIERMISLIDKEVTVIGKYNVVNQAFVATTVDFFRTYADLLHHGKEEGILFRDLSGKNLSGNDAILMKELIQEHTAVRAVTMELVKLAAAYQLGNQAALPLITHYLRKLVDFYPNHIDKEDKLFFPSSMQYFSEPEQTAMVDEFLAFEGKMIHDKYRSIVELLEK